MKKGFVLSLALLLCVLCAFAGCSGGDNSELVAYAEKQQDAAEAMSMTGFDLDFAAEGDSLVCTYKYGTGLLTEELAEITLNAVEASSDTMLESVKEEVPSCESVIFKIADSDGKILAEKEFK